MALPLKNITLIFLEEFHGQWDKINNQDSICWTIIKDTSYREEQRRAVRVEWSGRTPGWNETACMKTQILYLYQQTYQDTKKQISLFSFIICTTINLILYLCFGFV